LISDWTVGPVGGHISVGAKPRSYQVTPAGPSQPDVDKTIERQPRTGDRHRKSQTSNCFGSNHRSSGTTTVTLTRTEGFNRIIKQTKRVGCGYRNLANYERRILSHIAVTRPHRSAARKETPR
jgi:Transposase